MALNFIKLHIRSGVTDEQGVVKGMSIHSLETDLTGEEFSPLPHVLHALTRMSAVPENNGFPYTFDFSLD